MDAMAPGVGTVLPVRMPSHYGARRTNLRPFLTRLNAVTAPFRVFNEVMPDLEMPPNQVVVSGLWLDKSRLPENGSTADVRVLWHVHPSCGRVTFSPVTWGRRRFYFWERVAHELVHRHQDNHRDTDHNVRVYRSDLADDRETKEQQLYYGDYDELEAYAHDAAMEFTIWHPDLTFSQAVEATVLTDSWSSYLSAFDSAAPAAIAFKRKARSWWDSMQRYTSFYEKLSLSKVV